MTKRPRSARIFEGERGQDSTQLNREWTQGNRTVHRIKHNKERTTIRLVSLGMPPMCLERTTGKWTLGNSR